MSTRLSDSSAPAGDRDEGRVSELLTLQRLEFCAAGHAEFLNEVDGTTVDHLPHLQETFVRLKVRINYLSRDMICDLDDLGRGQYSHPANLGIERDKGTNIRFFVLERMNVTFSGLLDEFLVEILSAQHVLNQPLRARLGTLCQPGRQHRC